MIFANNWIADNQITNIKTEHKKEPVTLISSFDLDSCYDPQGEIPFPKTPANFAGFDLDDKFKKTIKYPQEFFPDDSHIDALFINEETTNPFKDLHDFINASFIESSGIKESSNCRTLCVKTHTPLSNLLKYDLHNSSLYSLEEFCNLVGIPSENVLSLKMTISSVHHPSFINNPVVEIRMMLLNPSESDGIVF